MKNVLSIVCYRVLSPDYTDKNVGHPSICALLMLGFSGRERSYRELLVESRDVLYLSTLPH
jgi:hypothetical protein